MSFSRRSAQATSLVRRTLMTVSQCDHTESAGHRIGVNPRALVKRADNP
jgi:hypothetical protein